jgi:DNA-binding NarL/FixJ family response regulator
MLPDCPFGCATTFWQRGTTGDNVRHTRLTPRERQIIRALARGGTNRAIAARLNVEEQTLKNQLSVIYAKLGVTNRLELALYAARERLLDHE